MDRPAPATPTHREIVLCHRCEEEWYRDEHGLVCPSCDSDFCEIIEAADDPRQSLRIPHREELAPDPDEDDIERYDDDGAFQPAGFRARFERTRSEEAGNQQPQQGSGLFGFLGSALRLASDFVQPGPVQNAGEQQEGQAPASPTQSVTQRAISPDGTTVTRHVHGNGYSFTMTTTRGLQPRDPSGVQPFNRQPNDINDMMAQILGNIGAMPHAHAGFAAGPGSMFGDDIHRAGAPPPFPGGLFQLLGLPLGGIHGDAVYSQEGLDRIISQLMEQHQTGNAPGPATENAIRSLPQRAITEEDLGDSGTAECSICMESVALDEKVTVLPCEHWFHYDCIEAWLSEHDTCPHCRKGIMPSTSNNTTDDTAQQPAQPPRNDTRSTSSTRPRAWAPYTTAAPGSGRTSEQAGRVHDRIREAFGRSSGDPSNNSRQA